MARPRQGVMLAYPFEAKRLTTYKPPFIIQPKYDGIRCKAEVHGGTVRLISSSGLLIKTVPHINYELGELQLTVPMILDGELYLHKQFQRLCSLVKRDFAHPDYHEVQFIVFDQVSDMWQEARLRAAASTIACLNKVKMAPWHNVDTVDEIGQVLDEYFDQGYEGIIIRHQKTRWEPKRSTSLMKWKPTRQDTYLVLGYEQEIDIQGNPKSSLGAFRVCDADGQSFYVGTGMTRQQRVDYWKDREELRGKFLVVKYQELTDGGIPRFPVFLSLEDTINE